MLIQVKIVGTAAVEGAKVQITSYYKTLADANKGTLTTTGTNLSAREMTCYLPDKVSTSKIEITVTAAKGQYAGSDDAKIYYYRQENSGKYACLLT